MKQLSLKDPITKIFIIVICIIAAAIFLGNKFIVKPHTEKVAKLKAGLEHIKLEDEIVKLQTEIDTCEKSLPPEKELSWLLTQLTTLAEQSKLNIESVEPLPPKQIPPYSYMSFKINTTCSFSQLLKFVQLIESSPYILNIESLKLASKGKYNSEVPKEELSKEVQASIEIVVGTIY